MRSTKLRSSRGNLAPQMFVPDPAPGLSDLKQRSAPVPKAKWRTDLNDAQYPVSYVEM